MGSANLDGRYRTRTCDLVRVKLARWKTGVDHCGICSSFWTLADRTKLQKTRTAPKPPPRLPPGPLTISFSNSGGAARQIP